MNITTIEELRAGFPDLVAQAETAAREEGRAAGIKEERSRIRGIEAIQNAIADKSLIDGAKYGDKPLTAEQLAFAAMQAQAAIGATVLKNIADDAESSNAESVTSAPNSGPETSAAEKSAEEEVAEIVNIFKKMQNGGRG